MNFYKHHIGDYAKKTGALSMMEHGAYLLMLHAYYATEKPLPFGRDLYRICRAFEKKERASVDKILSMFWTRTDEGFVNRRALEEMEIASELREIARQNGKEGGRPKKPNGLFSNNPAGLNNKPSGIPSGKAIQTPDSTIQTSDFKNQNQSSQQVASRKDPEPEAFKGEKPRTPIEIFRELCESNGEKPTRTTRLQHAIDGAGGWASITDRNTFTSPKIEKAFCVAWNTWVPDFKNAIKRVSHDA